MDAVELLERLAVCGRVGDGAVGETAAFAGFLADGLGRPLRGMNVELAGRGDTRTVRADFRLLCDPDTGALGGVEVALVLSDGTEFSRRYGTGSEGVCTGDRPHALACLLGDAARHFGLKDRYGKVRTYSLGGWKRGFDEDEEADFAARRDEGFVPAANDGGSEPAETELRYVEVTKWEGMK